MNEHDRTRADFDAKHCGEDGYVVANGNQILFSDGAMRGMKKWADLGYEYSDPPVDETEKATRQKTFWEIRLNALVAEFEQTKRRAANASQHDSHRFNELKKELKTLQTAVRSARSKLACFEVKVKGYNSHDVERAWEVWKKLDESIVTESCTKSLYEEGLLRNLASGKLEKLKAEYDEAKSNAKLLMKRWNDFTPRQARDIVSAELDEKSRQEREQELEEIEI